MNIFLDTMVYLHYRSADQIDWDALIGPSPHTIVIPYVVTSELDRHKYAHSSKRIRERAKARLSKIEKWTEGTSIRNGITAEFFDRYPHKALFNELELEPACNDDVLIASILRYTTSKETKDVMLVTSDTGLRLKAKRFTIPTLQLPDTYALTPDPDPLEIENRKLKERINVLQHAVPKLELSFTGSAKVETKQSFNIGKTIHSEEDIAKRVAEERSKFPKESLPPNTVLKSKDPGNIMAMKLAEFHTKTNPTGIP